MDRLSRKCCLFFFFLEMYTNIVLFSYQGLKHEKYAIKTKLLDIYELPKTDAQQIQQELLEYDVKIQ